VLGVPEKKRKSAAKIERAEKGVWTSPKENSPRTGRRPRSWEDASIKGLAGSQGGSSHSLQKKERPD